jgi:hypothetical protein
VEKLGSKELDTVKQHHLLPSEKGGFSNTGFIFSSRCAVCTSPEEFLVQVNRMLISGIGYREITDTLAPQYRLIGKEPLSIGSIRTHHQKHFDFQNEALRRIIQKRQAKIAGTWEEGVDETIDAIVTSEIIMRKGLNHVLNSETIPSVGDTLAAAKLNHELTNDQDGREQLAAANAQLARIIRAVQRVCTAEQWVSIRAIINGEDEENKQIQVFDNSDEYDDVEVEIIPDQDEKTY